MVRAICFDLDDTLYPYEQYAHAGLRAAAAHLEAETGVDVVDDLVVAYDAGIRSGTFDHVLDHHGLSREYVPDLIAAFHDRIGSLEPYPGAPRLLERLGAERRLGLITDGRNGREKLAELGLESAFDAVWVSPERGVTKREPDPFEETLAILDVDPDEAAYVGDHPTIDVAVPNTLGMRTVRVRQGRYAAESGPEPDVELESIGELPTVLEEPVSRPQK
ncbi:HAD family hydrolase [Natronobeatus ordinarius]|uniref:HAD family hydrolase n=1 Tax=Natronobeatus ordinarius TaxID=2963433 RepID=UPI0020CBC5BA|nr:HAD-IA family hydrolase [Natronobeatus ordinarius]